MSFPKKGEKIHSFCLTNLEDRIPYWVMDVVRRLKEDFQSFQMEIYQWYVFFSDCLSRQSGNFSVRKDDLLAFMDFLLENLIDYFNERTFGDPDKVKLIKAFEEMLTFLKNFICLVTLNAIEERRLEPLLAHTRAMAVDVARLSYLCWFNRPGELVMEYYDGDYWEALLQKIVPVETCKALISSNLSRRPHRKTDEHILRDTIDILLFNVWEILKSCTCVMISLRERLQILYEGLRSLRTILKEKRQKFDDEQMRDLTGFLVCDAGRAIFSLSLKAIKEGSIKERDLGSFELLEMIKLIKAIIPEKCPESPSLNFPRTNELGFIDFLLENMINLTSPEAGSNSLIYHSVQSIQKELVSLRSFLVKIVELRNEDEELQALWDRVVEAAYSVEFLIDSFMLGEIHDSSSKLFGSMLEEIKIMKAQALKICDSKRLLGKVVKDVSQRFNDMPSQPSKPITKDVVVGLKDEATSIINRLTRGSRQLQIVSIVGMPGLGKTTLAKKVYNDVLVSSYFYTRAWSTVSQVYSKKKLLLEILTCIVSNLSENCFKMSEEDLSEELYKCLRRNRYLIVLDDVWDIEAWNGLEASFPSDANGGRVIMTSRLHHISPQDKLDKEPHSLRQLTHEESWDLLKEKLFPGKGLPPKFCELQMQIVELCQGLPLTIVIVAGILANVDQDSWKEVVQSFSPSTVSCTEQCTLALELSYNHLPDHLKSCFLYFGAFPEDYEHTAKRLISLWVAEGFVQKTQFKSLDDVANDYMMDLIGRSLVMVSKRRSIGGVKTCRIHDLLHEFCVAKAKEEKFLQLVRGHDELDAFSVPHNLRRLCINSEPEHFIKSRLYFPTVRCLLYFAQGGITPRLWFDLSFIFCICRLLRVLDLSEISLGFTFPREVELLVQLRYLAVRVEILSIPSSIAKLSNLETFIVHATCTPVLLPDTIWNLKKLRHLHLKDDLFTTDSAFDLPTNNLDDPSQLCYLDTLSVATFSCWKNMDKILRKFPNIRQLKCKLYESWYSGWDASNKILVLDSLSQLESLTLKFNIFSYVQHQIEFQFPLSIKKLTLSGCRLPWCKVSAIEELPNLEVLKLLNHAFEGKIWNVEAEEFPKVKFLKLASLDIMKWTASDCDNYFPRLQKLVLEKCEFLEEIPSCLGNISTLEMIVVSDCPNSASAIEQIQEEQMSMGNTDLKIFVSSSNPKVDLWSS